MLGFQAAIVGHLALAEHDHLDVALESLVVLAPYASRFDFGHQRAPTICRHSATVCVSRMSANAPPATIPSNKAIIAPMRKPSDIGCGSSSVTGSRMPVSFAKVLMAS